MPPRQRERAVRQLKFWTADDEGNANIGKWLAKELGDERLAFFASFTNWCSQQAQRVSNPQTNWKTEELQKRAEDLRVVLRTQPLNVRAYIGLLEDYLKHNSVSGPVAGRIAKPESAGVFDIMKGQDRALEMFFTRMEREEMLVAMGRGHELSVKARRRRENRVAGDAALAEEIARAAETAEDNSSSLAQRGTTKDAVTDVEGEIAVADAIRAFGQAEITPREPWEGLLTDRTK